LGQLAAVRKIIFVPAAPVRIFVLPVGQIMMVMGMTIDKTVTVHTVAVANVCPEPVVTLVPAVMLLTAMFAALQPEIVM